MLTYSQRSGVWSKDGIILVSGCYAGRDGVKYTGPRIDRLSSQATEVSSDGWILNGKNNPTLQIVPNCGPLPRGVYRISPAHDIPHLGRFVMALTPDPSNQMFGRNSFFYHGDNPAHPGASSDGCIVGALDGRRAIENWRARGEDQVAVVE